MSGLRILLIGGGGREHALAWKLSQSPKVDAIVVVPGNGGTAGLAKVTNNETVAADDYPGLVALARAQAIDLVVPGPEAPLVDGVEGFFCEAGIPCFGPSAEAARMEGSKAFAKDFMKRHGIPTAAHESFTDYEQARRYLATVGHKVVIKASGLAAGKGVVIPQDAAEAERALREMMLDRQFGASGDEVVIEEFLEGEELSILSFSDGRTIKSLPPAQDHKRIGDGDTGPNTGGMGCYAPTRVATPELLARVEREVLQPTIDGMRAEGFPFRGCLFTGLMIAPDGDGVTPKVLEYNVRFGDPETQTLLPLLRSDLADILWVCASKNGTLAYVPVDVDPARSAATVVVAAPGYPNAYPKNIPMQVQDASSSSADSSTTDINIFHAGTSLDSSTNELRTSGGRVIAVTATAGDLRAAVDRAYEGIKLIQFQDMYYRRDIAHRAFRRDDVNASTEKSTVTYAQSGVSIDAGNALVQQIKAAVRSTRRPGADAEIGGFGGEIDLAQAGFATTTTTGSESHNILVGAIDGVGTKLKVALETGRHDTVGVDLVAMNVNDLVVQGARPLMFLDYFSCSRLDVATAAAFVGGVARGCRDAECTLVGGETAEMPGMYAAGDYDAAGAAVGIMAAAQRLPRRDDMRAGDVLLGLASSGVHSNGFSLVRRIVADRGLKYSDPVPWSSSTSSSAGEEPEETLGQALLTPTRIYVRSVLHARDTTGAPLKGMAHITGGGLLENVPRMLPDHLAAEIDARTWPRPPVFRWLAAAGPVAPAEMARTFNNGLGMVLVVEVEGVEAVTRALEEKGERVFRVGKLVAREEEGGAGCVLKGLESWE